MHAHSPTLVLATLLALGGIGADAVSAAEPAATGANKAPSTDAAATTVTYRPPLRGAPLSRVGGGTRSIQAEDLQVEVLAPEHTGLSLNAQPALYWYASRAITAPVEFSLVRPGVPEPVLEVTLEGPFEAGLHTVDLADHGVALAPDVDYEWYVSVVFDPAQRSSDVTAGAGVRHVLASGEFAVAGEDGSGAAYAAAGLWYDALEVLSAQAATEPAARSARTALLRQVGLEKAADDLE